MKAVGIVVEYNPFHNGHLYHLQETKKKTGADCVIAVMSGNFLQRGEPALVSKWARTSMAISAGVDLVIELPYTFAVQSAERFATGAVALLDALYCAELCFGSENGEIEPFLQAVQTIKRQPSRYNQSIQQALKEGMSYPQAVTYACRQLEMKEIDLAQPNNILGFSYVKAIIEQKSAMVPQTIQRIASGYHDEVFSHPWIASATSLRKALNGAVEELEHISPYIPFSTKKALEKYYAVYGTFHRWEPYFPFLKYRIMTSEESDLQSIVGVDEGIEYRLKQAITEAETFEQFLHSVKTKRYTWTRLQRMCVHILTHFKKEQMNGIKSPSYIRLLGMSDNGRLYLQMIKKRLSLPLVTTVSRLQKDVIYQQEKKAVAAYTAIFSETTRIQALKEEYATPPVHFSSCK
ncbi:HIGH Nucleotidyl Transferase family protein [Anoxybacillus sp. B7M1]|uniref:nucleotidyltransferase n=1 Tax=unclassified Anoxybacillus TaxID=2639704 RepID=UPI0005CD50EC|nr:MULTISPECIES: nucleotidyltransferase [unclassified Anoxybacillus]ANB55857.1 HIGH Nucleotidyl Transferase family protein [Anoxybacillus sp. B2M1]ANB64351.1 HIGH Nucleotidyl Transferase family protein [Anoxybacillus sp. B7M1]